MKPSLRRVPPGLALVALPWALSLAAAEGPLEHVLVTVPMDRQMADTALPITVLSGDALRRRLAATLGATLQGQPGLDSASFGPAVGQPVIRGHQGPRVRVLQNGLASMDAATTSADHAHSIEPMLAERIEVLRGPATLLYGGGAIGGVVNVIDRRIAEQPVAEPELLLGLRRGSAARDDTLTLQGEAGNGRINGQVSALYRDWQPVRIPGSAWRGEVIEREGPPPRRGVLANSDGRTRQLTLGGSYTPPRGHFGLAVSWLDNGYGIPPGGHAHLHEEEHEEEDPHDEAIRLDLRQWRVDLAGGLELEGGLERLRARLAFSDYRHSERESHGVTRFHNRGWEGRLEATHRPLAGWQGVVGLHGQYGNDRAAGLEVLLPVTAWQGVGLFVLESRDWELWTVELGLRLDQDQRRARSRRARRYTSLSASASALWSPSPASRLGVGLSRSERAPAVEELYSNADRGDGPGVVHGATQAVEIGTPELDSEISHNLELKGRWRWQDWQLEGDVYYNAVDRYVYLGRSGRVQGWPLMHYRQRGARLTGLEVTLSSPGWSVPGGLLSMQLHGDVLRGRLSGGRALPRVPARRTGLKLELEQGEWLATSHWLYSAGQRHPGRWESTTGSWLRWDLALERTLAYSGHALTARLQLDNLTNARIRHASSALRDVAPEPGRSLMLTLLWQR